jgi:hypothetical protein
VKLLPYLVIALLIIIILLQRACNKPVQPATEKVTIDTVYIKEAVTVPVYVPQPYAIVQVKEVPKYRIVEGEITTFIPVDTAEILKDYYSTYLYNDSVKVKYGTVYIKDSITQNRISARKVDANFTLPEIIKTVTIKEKARRYVSAGLTLWGSREQWLNGAGASLMYTDRNKFAVEAGAMYNGQINYSLGFKLPIKLKK